MRTAYRQRQPPHPPRSHHAAANSNSTLFAFPQYCRFQEFFRLQVRGLGSRKFVSVSGSGGAEQRGRGGGTRRGTGERLGRLCGVPLHISNHPSKRGPRSALPSHRDSLRPSCEFALPARAACAQAPARPARVPGCGRGSPAGVPLLYPSLSCAACCCAGRKDCAAGPCRPPRENHVVCATSEKAPARPARVPGCGRGSPAGVPLLYPSLSCAACCCAGRKDCAAGPCRPPRENHVVCATSEKAPARPAHVPGGGRGSPAGVPLLYPSLSCAACCCAGRTLRIFEFPSCSSHKWCFVFFRIRTATFCLVRRRHHCRLIILADTPGGVCVGLAGRLDAVFCAASYDGPVTWKVHVKRRDVDLPWP
jgi:hypothetical protein